MVEEHWQPGPAKYLIGHAPHDQALQAALPSGRDGDEVRAVGVRLPQDLVGAVAEADHAFRGNAQARRDTISMTGLLSHVALFRPGTTHANVR